MTGRRMLRKAARRLRQWFGAAHPVILMYHRVAALEHDPFALLTQAAAWTTTA